MQLLRSKRQLRPRGRIGIIRVVGSGGIKDGRIISIPAGEQARVGN
jgi:hypothetical protein